MAVNADDERPPNRTVGSKRRLTPQQMELEKLQHEARQGMQKQLQVEGSIRAMPAEAVVAAKAVNEAALAPHMPAMLSELSVDLPVGARRAHLSTCHGALLMGGVEHFVSTAGQRVCPDCQALCRDGGGGGRGQLLVERQRVRLLMSPVGVWSKARDFYTRWEVCCALSGSMWRSMRAGGEVRARLVAEGLEVCGAWGAGGSVQPYGRGSRVAAMRPGAMHSCHAQLRPDGAVCLWSRCTSLHVAAGSAGNQRARAALPPSGRAERRLLDRLQVGRAGTPPPRLPPRLPPCHPATLPHRLPPCLPPCLPP